eukprot:gene49386-60458_t
MSAAGGAGGSGNGGYNGSAGSSNPVSVFNAAGSVNGSSTVGANAALDASLGLTVTSQGGVGDFVFTGSGAWVPQTITTTTPGGAVVGNAQALSYGNSVTVNLVSPSAYVISAVSCTGMGSGSVSNTSSSITLSATALAVNNAVGCSVTLTRMPQLSVTFTVPSSANATLGLNPDASNGNGWAASSVTFVSGGAASQTVAAQTLSAANAATRLNQITPTPATYSLGTVTCTDANDAVSGNPSGPFTTSTPVAGSFQIAAANVVIGAQLNCVVPYLLPASAAQSTLTLAPAGPLVAGA